MAMNPHALDATVLDFLAERHIATLSISVPGHGLHVSPVGFSYDERTATARIITWQAAKKVRLLVEHGPTAAVVSQVDGGRWLALHGLATVSADPVVNADAERRYAQRYRPPGDRGADRRTIVIAVDRMLGRA